MALYVHPENQEILWNIMNQNPYLNSLLSYQSLEQKQEWFKNIIQTFYQQNSHKILDKTQLNQLNKDTLSYMINYAKASPGPSTVESSYLTQKNQRTVETFQTKISTPPIVPDNRADIFNQQFNTRQKEYETMLDKKPPTEPDFKEPLGDGVISNMDELIKRHMEERDAQLLQYAPKPPAFNSIPLHQESPASPIQQLSSTIQPVSNPIQQVSSTIQPVSSTIQPVSSPIQPVSSPIQQVSSPIQQVVTENITIQEENPLEEKVLQLSDKINVLVDEIQVLNKKVDILLNYNSLLYKEAAKKITMSPLITASADDYELGC